MNDTMVATRDQLNRRMLLLASGAGILLDSTLDLDQPETIAIVSVVLHLAWASQPFFLAAIAHRLSPRGLEWGYAAVALGTTICWSLLSFFMGGSSGQYFWAMMSAPLVFGVIAPGNLVATVTASVFTVLSNLLVMFFETPASRASDRVNWVVAASMMGCVAVLGTLTTRRLRESQAEAERFRAKALEDLATSEQRRLQAEKLVLVGKVAAGVAHEINNPLAFIRSNLDHVTELHRCPSRDELLPLLNDCQLGIDRIAQIVTSLNSFARRDLNDLEPCDLANLVAEAARLSAPSVHGAARLQIDVAADLPRVQANPLRLVQVLIGLLNNASEAIGEGGQGRGNIAIEGRMAGQTVVLTVSDDGPGVAPHHRDLIFDPFFTTKTAGRGPGMGLSIAREYLQLMDGSIVLDERQGEGACFRITLQVSPPAVNAEPQAA